MLTIRHNGNVLEIYNSIDELPIERYQAFNRFAMLDAGIGGDLASIDQRLTKLGLLVKRGNIEDIQTELGNLRQSLVFVLENTNPQLLSFVMLIKTINGKELTDISIEGAKATIELLSKKGFTIGKVKGILYQLKKKLMMNLTCFSQAKKGRKLRSITST